MKSFHFLAFLALAAVSSACQTPNNLTPLDATPIATPPQTITFKIKAYTPKPGHIFKQFFIQNTSIKAKNGILQPVTSRDALPDVVKSQHNSDYNFTLGGPNSANPYFGDLFLYLVGIQYPQQPLLYCASNLMNSTTNDAIIFTDHRDGMLKFLGLRDCEKSYLGLDFNKFDYDGDGIPDYLELRCGLNPKNANDAALAITGDGVNNLEKCKRNIPIDENADSQPNKLFAYNYDQKLQADGSTIFTISNIPIINGGLDNFFTFYLTELNSVSLQTTIYTAFSNLGANSQDRTFQIDFWGVDPAHATNQELIFP